MRRSELHAATRGFAYSFGAALLVGGAVYLLAPLIASFDPDYDHQLIEGIVRHDALEATYVSAMALLVYWGASAVTHRASDLGNLIANLLILFALAVFFGYLLTFMMPLRNWLEQTATYDCTPPCPGGSGFCLNSHIRCPNLLGWFIQGIFFLGPIVLLLLSLRVRRPIPSQTFGHLT